jgi:hypothetical protein
MFSSYMAISILEFSTCFSLRAHPVLPGKVDGVRSPLAVKNSIEGMP